MTATDKPTAAYLAWAGWQTRIPSDWRPLRIEGAWERGSMIVGDETEPLMQIKWRHLRKSAFDPVRCFRRRFKSLSLQPSPDPAPAPPGFSHAAWASEDLLDGTTGLLRVWYGYAPRANLLIEIVASGETPKKYRRLILNQAIPSLVTYPLDAAARWAVFGASFESPPDFRMTEKRLLLGDLTLRFARRGGSTLLLRQVYPASLALSRRPLERWLDARPFPERRKYRSLGPSEKWTVQSYGRKLEGIRTAGQKQLPFPLAFCAPRQSVAAALHDTTLDRLLLAEHDSPETPSVELLAACISRMNWAHWETEQP